MDALGHHDLFARMPPRSIQHQQDPPGRPGSESLSKVGKRDGEHLGCYRGQQQPFGLARSRLEKTVDVEPLVALMHAYAWARPFPPPGLQLFLTNARQFSAIDFPTPCVEGLLSPLPVLVRRVLSPARPNRPCRSRSSRLWQGWRRA
jgi:hypothetical protein